MSGSKATKSGVYLIVIDGLPEAYTWQDLKDFVRPQAEHEFWADLQSLPNSSGQKRGCVRTQRWKEALTLFKFLAHASVNGRRMRVVLWDISQSPPKQIAPEPNNALPSTQAKCASRVAVEDPSCPPGVPGQVTRPQGPAYATTSSLMQSMETLSLQQRQQQQAVYYARQQQQQSQEEKQVQTSPQVQNSQTAFYTNVQMQQSPRYDTLETQVSNSRSPPEYVSSQTGTLVNVRDGVALTVSRGVFVSGINFKAREDDIRRKFSSVGDVVNCALQTDNASGKSKGVATVLFSTSSEAQRAINKYDGATWMDKRIKVRVDKEATTLAAPPRLDPSPLIVNGSRVQ